MTVKNCRPSSSVSTSELKAVMDVVSWEFSKFVVYVNTGFVSRKGAKLAKKYLYETHIVAELFI